jgi:hypothetical protein
VKQSGSLCVERDASGNLEIATVHKGGIVDHVFGERVVIQRGDVDDLLLLLWGEASDITKALIKKEPSPGADGRGNDEMRREILSISVGNPTRMGGLIAESLLLLVEAVDRLTDSHDEHAGKTAAAVDYISDHLNEIGEKS